jgi:hypothetical protein
VPAPPARMMAFFVMFLSEIATDSSTTLGMTKKN